MLYIQQHTHSEDYVRHHTIDSNTDRLKERLDDGCKWSEELVRECMLAEISELRSACFDLEIVSQGQAIVSKFWKDHCMRLLKRLNVYEPGAMMEGEKE
jgi:hypothetical protein